MSENYESMLYHEVLEKLKRLEKENIRLREHLSATNSLIKQLQKQVDSESKSTSKHIGIIYGDMENYSSLLWPIAFKIFPKWAKAAGDAKLYMKYAASHPPKD